MSFEFEFLLINWLSIIIIIVEMGPIGLVGNDVLQSFANGGVNIMHSKKHSLKLSVEGQLFQSNRSIIWKGLYDDKVNVMIKFAADQRAMRQEIKILNALNAIDRNIEKFDIPRVYYYGEVLDQYLAIAMSLFDGTLDDLYKQYGGYISELQILKIFRQAVHGLKYLESKNVVHNDIKPQNIFLRGSKVFIGDFDVATLNGCQNWGHTKMFASTAFHENRDRYPISDLESLVFSMWYIAGIPLGISNIFVNEVEGKVLMEWKNAGKGRERVLEKCEHFKNPKVRQAFEVICVDEMLSNKHVPNYDLIIDTLDKAINELCPNSELVQFHWLTGVSGSESTQV